MNKLLKLPRWSILSLIVMTMLLSVVILAKIWFPDWVPKDIFWKVLYTYIVLICSAAVISRMSDYLKDMGDDQRP